MLSAHSMDHRRRPDVSDQAKILVTFEVGSKQYNGEVERTRIVHQAMEDLLPAEILHAHHLRVTRSGGTLIYPDMFLGEIIDFYGDAHFQVEAIPLREDVGTWTNYGFDHLALATTDRATARDFFSNGLQMK